MKKINKNQRDEILGTCRMINNKYYPRVLKSKLDEANEDYIKNWSEEQAKSFLEDLNKFKADLQKETRKHLGLE